MSADNRSVTTDALETLGRIIGPDEKRDAIHLAVEPVVAAHYLLPGDHVGFEEDGRVGRRAGKFLGVVDPFLPADGVNEGARFWLVVYPRQITSLRHVWDHPSFPASEAVSVTSSTADAERWMRAWAMEHMSEDYYGDGEKLSEEAAYANAIEAGRAHHIGPHEGARAHIDAEWWSNWEAITGLRGDREAFFSCGC